MFERGIVAFVLSGEGATIIFLSLCSVLSLAVMAERWLAYREGNLIRAEQLCNAANEAWQKTRGNVFHWLADWVLLAIAESQGDLAQAERYAQTLVDPNPLYQPLEAPADEKIHAGLYQDALENLGKNRETDYYVCQICGNTVEDEAPDRCPICNAPKAMFREVD